MGSVRGQLLRMVVLPKRRICGNYDHLNGLSKTSNSGKSLARSVLYFDSWGTRTGLWAVSCRLPRSALGVQVMAGNVNELRKKGLQVSKWFAFPFWQLWRTFLVFQFSREISFTTVNNRFMKTLHAKSIASPQGECYVLQIKDWWVALHSIFWPNLEYKIWSGWCGKVNPIWWSRDTEGGKGESRRE